MVQPQSQASRSLCANGPVGSPLASAAVVAGRRLLAAHVTAEAEAPCGQGIERHRRIAGQPVDNSGRGLSQHHAEHARSARRVNFRAGQGLRRAVTRCRRRRPPLLQAWSIPPTRDRWSDTGHLALVPLDADAGQYSICLMTARCNAFGRKAGKTAPAWSAGVPWQRYRMTASAAAHERDVSTTPFTSRKAATSRIRGSGASRRQWKIPAP